MSPRDSIRVNVFKDSAEPFTELLNEHQIEYYGVALNTSGPINAGEMIEIIKTIGNASVWPALATVIVAFLKARKSRKIIIQTKDNQIFHAEGYSVKEISKVLENAHKITAIETKKT